MNNPFACSLHHRQGDRWSIVFKVGADLSAKAVRFFGYDQAGTLVIDCDSADATLTLSYNGAGTIVVDGVTYTGVTTITPIISLVQSAALRAQTLNYDVEDYTTGDTYFIGLLVVDRDSA